MSTTEEKDELDDLDTGGMSDAPNEDEESEDEESPDNDEPVKAKKGPKAKNDVKKEDVPAEPVAESQIDPSCNIFGDVEILKRKRVFVEGQKGKAMRRALATSPLVQIALPVDSMNPKIKFQEFQMNSLYFRLPLGRQIKVPKIIEQFISQTMYRPRPAHEMFLSA